MSDMEDSSDNENIEESINDDSAINITADNSNHDETLEENNLSSDEEEIEVKMPVRNPLNYIKNKQIRNALYKKDKLKKTKGKKLERKKRQKTGTSKGPGHTIESLREKDQTVVQHIDDSDNEELRKELELDEFNDYYNRSYAPKILITFVDNPVVKTRRFGKELSRIIPNSICKTRNNSSIKKICKSCIRDEFTDVIIINENHREPNGLLVVHLPNGPTVNFRMSNVKLTSNLKRNYKEISKHRPEVILTNFTTRLGLTVGRMFGSIFHHEPEFKGRRSVTFHNQRDYIFFRHHRYEFANNGKRVKLRELGPRFTLKLVSLQEGLFDSKCGDYAWTIKNKRHSIENRRRFFL